MTTTGICQNTTTVNDEWLQNAIKWIEQGKVDAQLVKLLTQKTDSLTKRIGILESIVKTYKAKDVLQIQKDSAQVKVTAAYEEELKNTREQRDLGVKGMKKLDKKLRRQKTATILVPILTAGLTAAGFIFLK